MIRRLNHIAIAVPDLGKSIRPFKQLQGFQWGALKEMPDHGVIVVMAHLSNVDLEFLAPLDEDSPIHKFLERHPRGGLHHLCFETEELDTLYKQLEGLGVSLLDKGQLKVGFQGKRVFFTHPHNFCGTLLEFEEQ